MVNYSEKILKYCKDMDYCNKMLSALEADLEIDAYQDTQPGGGDCVYNTTQEMRKYSKILDELTPASVFDTLYEDADTDTQKLLEDLLNQFSSNYLVCERIDRTVIFCALQFLKNSYAVEFGNKDFTAEDIPYLLEKGQYMLEHLPYEEE